MRRILVAVAIGIFSCYVALGFSPQITDPKATEAYQLLVLRKISVAADLVDLTKRYSVISQLVQSKRFELDLISREIDRLLNVDSVIAAKLSASYGKLLMKKVDLEVELSILERVFTSQHPRVTRTRVTIDLLDQEIQQMLS